MPAEQRFLMLLMPWATPHFPGIGPTLLRSVLVRDGIGCDIVYANLLFSRIVDGDPFVERELFKLPICEALFSPHYFPMSRTDAARAVHEHVTGMVQDPNAYTMRRFEDLVDCAGRTLDEIMASTDWDAYDIVGFSVMMQQTVPSLALAKRIKAVHPRIRIVFGGPNASGPCGAELLRSFPEIDVVVDGEADGIITPLVREMRAGGLDGLRIGGVRYRAANGLIRETGPAKPYGDMDALPVPDFGPYLQQLETLRLDHVQPYLTIETSRGCWWGQKHHCTFCGIDDAILTFRSKSHERVVDEILELSERHCNTDIFAVDSIINHRFFTTVLPEMQRYREESEYDFTFFFESKSNLRPEQTDLLRAAGVNAVQPGLESFSDHVLALMDKGTTGARQIQCLKLLAERNIVANWNLIYRNPGELPQDYDEVIEIIGLLHHLQPLHEDGLIPMQLNRYAPYFERPADFGIQNVRPKDYYQKIFPDPSIDLGAIAFYFDYDHPVNDDQELAARHAQLRRAIARWRELYRPDSLVLQRGPGFIVIEDRRLDEPVSEQPGGAREIVTYLDGVQAEMFSFCEVVRSERELMRTYCERIAESEISAFIERMVARRLMYRSPAGQLITLPLASPVRVLAPVPA